MTYFEDVALIHGRSAAVIARLLPRDVTAEKLDRAGIPEPLRDQPPADELTEHRRRLAG